MHTHFYMSVRLSFVRKTSTVPDVKISFVLYIIA